MGLNDNFSKSNTKELNNKEKNYIFDFVIDFGIPRKINGEENYLLIYEKLKEKKVFNEIIEKDELNELIQGIKNFIINVRKKLSNSLNDNDVGEKSKDNITIDEFDITVEKGKLFMNNIHMFEIIRKK